MARWNPDGGLTSRHCLLVDGMKSFDIIFLRPKDITSLFGKICLTFINDSPVTRLGLYGSGDFPMVDDSVNRNLYLLTGQK